MQPPDERAIAAARLAAQAWRAAMRRRQELRPQPPWDEQKYFDNPLVNTVALVSNTDKIIAAQNPFRVGIIFSIPSPSPVGGLFVRPGSAQTNGTGSGILLATGMQLRFTQSEWGNLVQAEWHGQSIGANSTVYVVEVLLRIWSNGG
jgi:hypothetical protein